MLSWNRVSLEGVKAILRSKRINRDTIIALFDEIVSLPEPGVFSMYFGEGG